MRNKYFKSIHKKYSSLDNVFKLNNRKACLNNDDTLLFNMQSAEKCINRLNGLCQLKDTNKCNQYKFEKQYSNTKKFRYRQSIYWATCSIEDIVQDIIRLKTINHKVKYIRFNESGDMTKEDLYKLAIISNMLLEYDIHVFIYTASHNLLEHKEIINMLSLGNLTINGSGFMWDNEYKQYNKTEKVNKEIILCPCTTNCKLCKESRGFKGGFRL